jgi:hypothetical protein
MTDSPRRLIEIGVLPSGYTDIFVDGVDPVAVMVREANERLERERVAAEKARQATAIADVDDIGDRS